MVITPRADTHMRNPIAKVPRCTISVTLPEQYGMPVHPSINRLYGLFHSFFLTGMFRRDLISVIAACMIFQNTFYKVSF